MKQRRHERFGNKYAAVRAILSSGANEAQQRLLLTVTGRYNALNRSEERQLESRIAQENLGRSDMAVDLRDIAGQLDLENARVEGKREALLVILRNRFGELPPATVEAIESINYDHEIDPLISRAATAKSLGEVGITEA